VSAVFAISMMATGRGKHTSILNTPLQQPMNWRLLSPMSPHDVRQRKLVDSDLQCHATSTPCESDNKNARLYDGWVITLSPWLLHGWVQTYGYG